MVRAALRLLEDRETKLRAVREALIEAENAGPGLPFDRIARTMGPVRRGKSGDVLSLRELEKAVPALLDIRSAERRSIDWEFIRRETGILLPPDFVALAEAYPPFTVDDFLGVRIPSPGEEKYFVSGARELLGDLAMLRDAGMSHGHVPFPEPGGLFPWAVPTGVITSIGRHRQRTVRRGRF